MDGKADSIAPSCIGGSFNQGTQPAVILAQLLPELPRLLADLEERRTLSYRVDGRIIGTGEADFTKGNVQYTLDYQGKIFCLIDVPGIEGDEQKYVEHVRRAIAKAHLVFYVNGTNKKPEKATAEKIRSYLGRGASVCPIINVRGNADAYEFEEDRLSLEEHGDAGRALKQTVSVLSAALGSHSLLEGKCVQGLLAFSSLALDGATGKTTVHPSRAHDLAIQQRNYLRYFDAPTAFGFSRISSISEVLNEKLSTFKEDIVESNKRKVRELLAENLGELDEALKQHKSFSRKTEPELQKCREALAESLKTFERLLGTGRKSILNEFFDDISGKADDIVASHIGDNDRIGRDIARAFESGQPGLRKNLKNHLDVRVAELQESVQQAMKRLLEDLQRVQTQQRRIYGEAGRLSSLNPSGLSSGFGWKDAGMAAIKIGSYAMTGAGIGATIGGVVSFGALAVPAAAIGAAIGAVVGFAMTAVGWIFGKEGRIRKAQSKVQEIISEKRAQVLKDLKAEVRNMAALMEKDINDTSMSEVERLHESLIVNPSKILERQINLMKKLKENLEHMPYGTIQAVQH